MKHIEILKKILLNDFNAELEDLVGTHELSGVGRNIIECDANSFSFILDGITFTAIEDPEDGYRSTMKELFIGGEIKNTFKPVEVECILHDKTLRMNYKDKLVLEVGTDNYDDYYPVFVNHWNPENIGEIE